jgi:hypothetical protein
MDSFEAEVGGDQHLMAKRKPEYGAIVANTLQHAISCARLLANAGDQSFFEKRQSEANIDDKTIPPKPATLGGFPQSNPARIRFIYPSPQAAHHSDRHMPPVAVSMARVGRIG